MMEFINARVVAASGALELGLPDLATDELEDIPTTHRLHREVLMMRAMTYKQLNVAGSRESKDLGIYRLVIGVLEGAFFWSENHPGLLDGPGEG
jgi:hypothetical protein